MANKRARLQFLKGTKLTRPLLLPAEPSVDLDTSGGYTLNIGNGTFLPEPVLMVNANQVLKNKLTHTPLPNSSAGAGVDSYEVTIPIESYTSYQLGLIINFFAHATNTTNAPTFKLNGLPAVQIISRQGTALTPGYIQLGGIYTVVFDGVQFRA